MVDGRRIHGFMKKEGQLFVGFGGFAKRNDFSSIIDKSVTLLCIVDYAFHALIIRILKSNTRR